MMNGAVGPLPSESGLGSPSTIRHGPCNAGDKSACQSNNINTYLAGRVAKLEQDNEHLKDVIDKLRQCIDELRDLVDKNYQSHQLQIEDTKTSLQILADVIDGDDREDGDDVGEGSDPESGSEMEYDSDQEILPYKKRRIGY